MGNGLSREHFYITLPSSSSSDLYPVNEANNFTNNLLDIISLDSDYEVALVEFHLSGTIKPSDNIPINEILVYSDICSCSNLGDKLSPILRVIPVNLLKRNSFRTHIIYNSPHYVPVASRIFSQIKIELRTITGDFMPIEEGHCIVKLHFKKLFIFNNNLT